MRLITHLNFLLRLQISAVVTVLLLSVFMVYTGATLPSTIVLEELPQYPYGCDSIPQKLSATWSCGTLCHCTVPCCVKNTECSYLNICIEHGNLETSVHVGFPSV